MAGFLTARPVGVLADRFGARTATLLGLLAGGAVVPAMGLSGSLALLALSWALGVSRRS
jgi:sugar phosphate permease